MVKIEKKWEEKFDYTTLNDRDKKIVKEVLHAISIPNSTVN